MSFSDLIFRIKVNRNKLSVRTRSNDPKLKVRDHAVDALRYGLSHEGGGPVDAFK